MLPYFFALFPPCLVAGALAWLLGAKPRSRLQCVMLAAVCGSIVSFAFLVAPWAFTSYYLRYISLGMFALAVMCMYRRMKFNMAKVEEWSVARSAFSALALFLFTLLDALSIAAYHQPGHPLDLSFPLTSGSYYVLQGGNSMVTNPFHAWSGNRQSFDIVELNAFGNRADGIAPRALNGYEIFREKVYSPCEGSVSSMRDGLPDNAPGRPDIEHPEGNYIVLKCGDAEVLLAHLNRGSITMTVGEVVAVGQPLANIGNSGNSLEPHLHISATKKGAATGLMFNGRKLSVNSVVTR